MPTLMEEPPSKPEPALVWRHTKRSVPPSEDEYAPFGNVEARNGLQERIEIPLMILALRLPLGGRILEVGCGRGVALPVLSRWLVPRELVGVDVDATLVDVATRRVRDQRLNARVLEADVRSLPIADGSFDMVIDFGTCYHVSGGTQGSLAAMREISRVLRPGGLFIHETPIAQHLAHPVRSFGRSLPWRGVPSLARDRSAVLWSMRRKSMLPW
jgi:SAM-dependent methyltransferase